MQPDTKAVSIHGNFSTHKAGSATTSHSQLSTTLALLGEAKAAQLTSSFFKWRSMVTMLVVILSSSAVWATTTNFTASGNSTWTCPADVTSVTVECWGGGGGGGGVGANDTDAGGGAGGSYVKYIVSVIPKTVYNLTVGAGGTGGSASGGNDSGQGGSSYFGNTTAGNSAGAIVLAVGGLGGNGGGITAGTSTARLGGAAGGTATTSGNIPNSGAAANTAGTSGETSVAGASGTARSGAGGAGAGSSGNAGGGAGGTAVSNNGISNNGNPGTAPGGGGSGAESNTANKIGGAGGAGQVTLTYTPTAQTYTYVSSSSSVWLTSANWTPSYGPPTNSIDTAVFDSTTTQGTIGMAMSTLGGSNSIGEIQLTGGANRIINNSSTTVAGTLILNGVNNVALQNNSTFTMTLTNGSSENMNVAFWNSGQAIDITGSGGITIGSVITGDNGFIKTGSGSGVLTLSGVNTYNGDTAISAGTLALSGSGSINNSPNIIVNGTLDVSGHTGAYNLVSGQTLKGSGAINGTIVFASGTTLSPGNSIGTLTFTNAPTFSGTNYMKIDRAASANADEIVLASGTLTYGGTLVVTNINAGNPPVSGDSFTNFSASAFSGWFSSVTLPALVAGLNWDTNKLATTGVLDVYSFTTTPLAFSTRTNQSATLVAGLLLNHAVSLRGTVVVSAVSTPANGATVLNGDGSVTYTPATSFAGGSDSFTITFQDGHGLPQTIMVSATVNGGSGGQSANVLASGTTNINSVTYFYANFAGVPDQPYTVETNSVVNGAGWVKEGNYTAPSDNTTYGLGIGVFQVKDPVVPGSLYYRTVWPAY